MSCFIYNVSCETSKKVNCFTFLDVEPNSDVRSTTQRSSVKKKYESELNCRVCVHITSRVQKGNSSLNRTLIREIKKEKFAIYI